MIVMDEYLTVEEVSKELKVSRETILRLLRQRKLIGFKVSGVWRVTRDDLRQYVDTQRKTQTE